MTKKVFLWTIQEEEKTILPSLSYWCDWCVLYYSIYDTNETKRNETNLWLDVENKGFILFLVDEFLLCGDGFSFLGILLFIWIKLFWEMSCPLTIHELFHPITFSRGLIWHFLYFNLDYTTCSNRIDLPTNNSQLAIIFW